MPHTPSINFNPDHPMWVNLNEIKINEEVVGNHPANHTQLST